MGQILIDAKSHLTIGENYSYHGEPVQLLNFEDDLTCSILIDMKSSRVVPKKTFLNKIYRLINFPLDCEIQEYTYKKEVFCFYYMLKEI